LLHNGSGLRALEGGSARDRLALEAAGAGAKARLELEAAVDAALQSTELQAFAVSKRLALPDMASSATQPAAGPSPIPRRATAQSFFVVLMYLPSSCHCPDNY
jgi:hypothetical protein